MKKLLLLPLLIVISFSVNAQWEVFNTTNSGLKYDYIKEIAIDANGDKWIATDTCVQKFDGTTWTTYAHAQGINYDAINCIAVKNGIVWVGTNMGASKFDGATWTNYSNQLQGWISDIEIAADNIVWFANNGISKFDGTTWTHYDYNNETLGSTSISIDNENNIVWVGTNCFGSTGGVYSFNMNTNEWTYYDNGDPQYGCVHGVASSKNGKVFVGTCNFSGIRLLENGNYVNSIGNTACVSIDGMAIEPSDSISVWIATEGGFADLKGLLFYDGVTVVSKNTTNSEIPTDNIISVTVEKIDANTQKLWLGSFDKGIITYTYNPSTLGINKNQLINEMIKLYPNPTNDFIQIDNPENKKYTIELCNILGEVISTYNISSETGQIDIRHLEAQLYYIKIIESDVIINVSYVLKN